MSEVGSHFTFVGDESLKKKTSPPPQTKVSSRRKIKEEVVSSRSEEACNSEVKANRKTNNIIIFARWIE